MTIKKIQHIIWKSRDETKIVEGLNYKSWYSMPRSLDCIPKKHDGEHLEISVRSLSCIEVQKMYWCESIQVMGRPVRKLNSPNESYFIPSTNVEASSYLFKGRSIGRE